MLVRKLVTRVPAASIKVTTEPVESSTRTFAPNKGAPAAATPVTTGVPLNVKIVAAGGVGVVGVELSPPPPPPHAPSKAASTVTATSLKSFFVIQTVSWLGLCQ